MPQLWEGDEEGGCRMYYRGIGPEEGTIVEADRAYDYALERCLHGTLEDKKEFREMLTEWYYSGNWTKEDI